MSPGPPARREMEFIMGPKPRVCMFLSTAFNNDLKQPDAPRMQMLTEEQECLHIILTSTSLKPRRQVAWSLIYRWGKPAVQPACARVGPGGQRSLYPTAAYMDVTTMISGHTHHWADSPRQTHETFESRDTADLVSWIRDRTVIECLCCTRCLVCAVLLWRIPFLLFCRWGKQRLRAQELGHVAVSRWEVGIRSQEGGPSLGTCGPEFESKLYHLITARLHKLPSMFRPQFPYI